jgi:hypothetical protein
VAHLDDGLHSGLACRALGHYQNPDGLDGAVLGLARTRRSTADGGPCRFHCIEGVGLAVVAPGLSVLAVDLDHLDALAAEEPREPDAIGAGAFDSNLGDLAELLEPGQQRPVASRIGWERLGANESAQRVQRRSYVAIEVGVDTSGDAGTSFYDGHGHPFLPESG